MTDSYRLVEIDRPSEDEHGQRIAKLRAPEQRSRPRRVAYEHRLGLRRPLAVDIEIHEEVGVGDDHARPVVLRRLSTRSVSFMLLGLRRSLDPGEKRVRVHRGRLDQRFKASDHFQIETPTVSGGLESTEYGPRNILDREIRHSRPSCVSKVVPKRNHFGARDSPQRPTASTPVVRRR
jgi:hypothetical protein